MQVIVVVLVSLLLFEVAGAGTTVYRCIGENGPVYSDQPCSEESEPHEIDHSRVTVYTPPPARKGATPASAKPAQVKRAKAVRLPDPAKHAATCARLEQALRDVRTKMRSGYGAKQGERLKARRRQLDDRRRIEKCS